MRLGMLEGIVVGVMTDAVNSSKGSNGQLAFVYTEQQANREH